jgi:hypothetical protein
MYCITLRSRIDARITGWYDGSESRWSTDHKRQNLFDKKRYAKPVCQELRKLCPRNANFINVEPAYNVGLEGGLSDPRGLGELFYREPLDSLDRGVDALRERTNRKRGGDGRDCAPAAAMASVRASRRVSVGARTTVGHVEAGSSSSLSAAGQFRLAMRRPSS